MHYSGEKQSLSSLSLTARHSIPVLLHAAPYDDDVITM